MLIVEYVIVWIIHFGHYFLFRANFYYFLYIEFQNNFANRDVNILSHLNAFQQTFTYSESVETLEGVTHVQSYQ